MMQEIKKVDSLGSQGEVSIPTLAELLFSLPVEFQSSKVIEQLARAYDDEVKWINEYASRLIKQGKDCAAVMCKFDNRGSQWVANFSVKNLSIPESNQYNWHLQNVSQWVYAGCILFDERSFKDGSEWIISTHH